MWEIESLGTGGLLGVLVGVCLVLWIQPDTDAGTALIIVVAMALMTVMFAAGRALLSIRSRQRDSVRPKEDRGQGATTRTVGAARQRNGFT